MYGIAVLGWSFAAHCGSSPSRAIAKKMRGCPYWNTSSTADIETAAPSATIQPDRREARRARARAPAGRPPRSSLYGTMPGQHDADDHVDHRADRQAAEDADRQVALRVLRLLRRRRDRVEADVGEEHDRRALVDAGEAVGRERRVVRRVDVRRADDDEQRQHEQLDHHHDVVGAGALLRAAQQQPGDQHHDRERRHVEQDRDAGDVRRRVEQAVDVGIGAEQRGAIAGA